MLSRASHRVYMDMDDLGGALNLLYAMEDHQEYGREYTGAFIALSLLRRHEIRDCSEYVSLITQMLDNHYRTEDETEGTTCRSLTE